MLNLQGLRLLVLLFTSGLRRLEDVDVKLGSARTLRGFRPLDPRIFACGVSGTAPTHRGEAKLSGFERLETCRETEDGAQNARSKNKNGKLTTDSRLASMTATIPRRSM